MRQQLWEWWQTLALMEETSCLSSKTAGRHQCSTGLPERTGRDTWSQPHLKKDGGDDPTSSGGNERVSICSEAKRSAHLVSLVVESDPGDSGVSWTSEAEDLLGVTPLKHPHATILSSRQVWKTTLLIISVISFIGRQSGSLFWLSWEKFPFSHFLLSYLWGITLLKPLNTTPALAGNANAVATRSKKPTAGLREMFQLLTVRQRRVGRHPPHIVDVSLYHLWAKTTILQQLVNAEQQPLMCSPPRLKLA